MATVNEWTPERVRALRKRTGLSMERFGAKLAVSWQTVLKWEKGTQVPSLARCVTALESIAREFPD